MSSSDFPYDHFPSSRMHALFVTQMISLMDNLLKRENLDLRLTPYRVLPTGSDDGLVEFVPSAPLSRILAEHRTIHKFLAQTQADPTGATVDGCASSLLKRQSGADV